MVIALAKDKQSTNIEPILDSVTEYYTTEGGSEGTNQPIISETKIHLSKEAHSLLGHFFSYNDVVTLRM